MIEGLPGFRGSIEVGRLITAAAFLVAGPLIGWVVFRLIKRKVGTGKTITSWGGDDIVLGALRDIVVVWGAVGGAFGALQTIRFQRAVPAEGLPSVAGLRVPIAEVVEKFLIAVLIMSAAVVVARVVTDVIKLYSLRTEGTTRSSSLFVVVARVVVYLVALLVLLQSWGISITPLLGALGVGGLAVALAMQDTLSNFFGGLQILATKKVKPGDFVKLESGEEGYVVDVDWRHTSIRQLPNNMILVPNSTLVNSTITNYYYPETEVSVIVQVGVSYDSDLEHVEQVTVEVARGVLREVDGGVMAFEPFIRYHTFDDSSINFSVILRAREITDQFLLKHEFVKRLHDRYRREGIEIPFPIRTVRMAGGGEGADARGLEGSRRHRG